MFLAMTRMLETPESVAQRHSSARLVPKPADEWPTPPANSREQMMDMAQKRGIQFRSDSRRPVRSGPGHGPQ